MTTPKSDVRIGIFGAPLDTGNLGVSALGLSIVSELAKRLPDAELALFDHGSGVRRRSLRIGEVDVQLECRGAWISRRLYRSESLWAMLAASRLAPSANPSVRWIDASTAVLDISGGDSFADTYGRKQFRLVELPKRIALNVGRPLVLLPQTYGPFHEGRSRDSAVRILESVDRAWARDPRSYQRLQQLLGERFDAARHREGVDVAFALPLSDPGRRLGHIAGWLDDELVVGVNVSGLLANRPESAAHRFGLTVDYPSAIERLVRCLLEEADVHVLLVPHVRGASDESDDQACARLLAAIGSNERVAVLPQGLRADEVKYVVSRLAWFTGARMHATIAALSALVPVAAMAYSDKFQGVFDRCAMGHRVLDARTLTTNEVVEAAVAAWRTRELDREPMRARIPVVQAVLEEQFDDVVSVIASGGDTAPRRE